MKRLPGADEVKLTKNIFPNDERLLDYVTCKRQKKERNMEGNYDMAWEQNGCFEFSVLLKVFMIKGLKYGKGLKKPTEKKKIPTQTQQKPNKKKTKLTGKRRILNSIP